MNEAEQPVASIPKPMWPDKIPSQRYGGDGLSWSTQNLAESDRESLSRFYWAVNNLLGTMPGDTDDKDTHLNYLRTWMDSHDWRTLRRDVAAVGPDTYAEVGTHPILRKVLHDVRGGPMTSLSVDLGLLRIGTSDDFDPHRVFLLARDVRKIMRNAFPDIDSDGFETDRQLRAHSVQLLVEKWTRFRITPPVDVECHFVGAVAETCIEFSALDRVLYNVMNNAVREGDLSKGAISLRIEADNADEPTQLRFTVCNPVLSSQSQRLVNRFKGNLSSLFTTQFSTTGSGIGLQVVGDFVARAYDLPIHVAISGGYVGASLKNEMFRVWFHWPVVDEVP